MQAFPRVIWRLTSPARQDLACDVVRKDGVFELRVLRGGIVLMTYPAADLSTLHRVAAEWHAGLCARGYAPDASVLPTESAFLHQPRLGD